MSKTVPDHYDPLTYWAQREHPNTGEAPGISPPHRQYFSEKTIGAKSILELGPGIGRLFPLYKGIERVAALDLSHKYQDHAKDAARRADIPLEQHFLSNAVEIYPFNDEEFDIAIASFVLLHVPFENIRHTISELSRVSKKVVVFDGDDPNWPSTESDRKPSSHCFRHDHEALCRELNFTKSSTERFQGGSIGFTFSR